MDKPNNTLLVEELEKGDVLYESKKKRRDVFVSFFVQGVHEIDIIKQRFHVSFIMYAAWDVNLDDFAVPDPKRADPKCEWKDTDGKWNNEEDTMEWKDSDGKWHNEEDTMEWKDSDGKSHQLSPHKPTSWRESMFRGIWDDQQNPQLTFPNCVQWTKTDKKWLRVVECNEEGGTQKYKNLSPMDIIKLKEDGMSDPQKKVRIRIILAEETQGWFEENFELKDFPYDLQHLHIAVTSRWDHETVAVVFDEIRGTQIHSKVLTDQTWQMSQPRLFSYKQDWEPNSLPLLSEKGTSATGKQYCRAYLALTVLRRSGYVMYNVWFILALVGTMSFFAYANHPIIGISDRQQIILILVLTTVTFKYITMAMTPDIPYPTMIDYIIYGTMVLQVLMLLCISISVLLDDPVTFDYICVIVLAQTWLTSLVYFCLKCCYLDWYRDQYVMHCNKIFDDYGKGKSGKPKILPEPNWYFWFNVKNKDKSRYPQNSCTGVNRKLFPYYPPDYSFKDTCVSLGVLLLITLGLCGYFFIDTL